VKWILRQVELNAINIEMVQAAVSVREGEAIFEDRGSHIGQLVDASDSVRAARDAQRTTAAVQINFSARLLSRHCACRATNLRVPVNSVGHFGAYLVKRDGRPSRFILARVVPKNISRRAVGVQYVAVRKRK
jgi:hypothetical protein